MTYAEFIQNQLRKFPTGQPIYTRDIAAKLAAEYKMRKKEAAAATAVAFKRILEHADVPSLRFYQKGVYYLTAVTPFGETGIDRERLIADKYLLPDIGYETGYTELYRLGLTSQIPKIRCIATNKAGNCARKDMRLGITVKPPKAKIDAGNKSELQLLDIVELMDKAPIDAEKPYVLLARHLLKTGMSYGRLIALAHRYYTRETVWRLARIADEGGL